MFDACALELRHFVIKVLVVVMNDALTLQQAEVLGQRPLVEICRSSRESQKRQSDRAMER